MTKGLVFGLYTIKRTNDFRQMKPVTGCIVCLCAVAQVLHADLRDEMVGDWDCTATVKFENLLPVPGLEEDSPEEITQKFPMRVEWRSNATLYVESSTSVDTDEGKAVFMSQYWMYSDGTSRTICYDNNGEIIARGKGRWRINGNTLSQQINYDEDCFVAIFAGRNETISYVLDSEDKLRGTSVVVMESSRKPAPTIRTSLVAFRVGG